MRKLIQLEFAKYKFAPYLLAALCIYIFGFLFCFMISLIPVLERGAAAVPIPNDMELFMEWPYFIALIATVLMAGNGILSAVMHVKITIEEYSGKRAVLLFSYPCSRSRILFTKSSLVFFMTAIFTFIGTLAAVLPFALISNLVGIMPHPFTAAMLPYLLTTSGVFALMAAAIGLVSMRVGFFKKSIVAPVVTAFILIIPFSNSLSLFPEYSGMVRIIGMAVLLLAGLLIMVRLLAKVNKMEVL